MKQIVISLTDNEWKELADTVRHELGEPLSDDEIENIVRRDIAKFIRDDYLRALGT